MSKKERMHNDLPFTMQVEDEMRINEYDLQHPGDEKRIGKLFWRILAQRYVSNKPFSITSL